MIIKITYATDYRDTFYFQKCMLNIFFSVKTKCIHASLNTPFRQLKPLTNVHLTFKFISYVILLEMNTLASF